MKRVLALILALFTLAATLTSCAEEAEYENVEYKENGLYFILPNTMRRKSSGYYEFYFSNELMGVVFSAKKITSEILEDENIDTKVNAKEYVDIIFERRGLDREKAFYTYFEDSDQHNFRYTFVDEDESETFFYVTVTGENENLWYIEMYCKEEESVDNLNMFEKWRKTIGTYQEG